MFSRVSKIVCLILVVVASTADAASFPVGLLMVVPQRASHVERAKSLVDRDPHPKWRYVQDHFAEQGTYVSAYLLDKLAVPGTGTDGQ